MYQNPFTIGKYHLFHTMLKDVFGYMLTMKDNWKPHNARI